MVRGHNTALGPGTARGYHRPWRGARAVSMRGERDGACRAAAPALAMQGSRGRAVC